MATKTAKRRDEVGRAYAGSMLQVQIYVNKRQEELDRAIVSRLGLSPEPVIDWRSPLASDRYAEAMDGRFLEKLDLAHLRTALRNFWPRSGPRWDGLAILRGSRGGPPIGYLLVEGKSYPGEVYGGGCKSPAETLNRRLIEAALESMARDFRLASNSDWTGRLYQFANRLAHVRFLRDQTGLPAWLVNLCFLDDPHRPTGREAWESGLETIKQEFGIGAAGIPHTLDVLLPARDRSELLT